MSSVGANAATGSITLDDTGGENPKVVIFYGDNNADTNATEWTPAQLASTAWLDASDSSTITTTAGKVSQWNDKSGSNQHFVAPTAQREPTYGARRLNHKKVVDFIADDYLNGPNFESQYLHGRGHRCHRLGQRLPV
jgi:hypothetical protein